MNMKQWLGRSVLMLAASLCVLTFTMESAEAGRLGGGRSIGKQSSSVSQQRQAAPQQAPAAAPQSAAQPQRNRWLGPLAGLAAGLGIAALLSHFGLGAGVANFVMIALMVMVVIFVVGFLLRKLKGASAGRRPAYESEYRFSHLGQETVAGPAPQSSGGYTPSNPLTEQHPVATSSAAIPAGFDTENFVRNAKVMFLRLQAAFDVCNQDDLREFTSPEMFAELKLQLQERSNATQKTDVVTLNAELLSVETHSAEYLASVRFSGMLREAADQAASPIDEVWNFSRSVSGSGGWVLAGIQQLN